VTTPKTDRHHTRPRPRPGDRRTEARRDLDRLLHSTSFQRLVGVTQVVTPNNGGRITHNRLTHSLKVAQVARSVAEHLKGTAKPRELEASGGLDPDTAEAAGLAHDLGHPPFGHVGEQVLDALALQAGLPKGFEGNAQSFRIVTRLEPKATRHSGLDLTAGTRAAILKYPWPRAAPEQDADGLYDADATQERCRADPDYRRRWHKFGVYATELDDFEQARGSTPAGAGRQSLEASVMDIADDITYALHDLEDFLQAGLFDGPRADAELEGYSQRWARKEDMKELVDAPGTTFARLRQDLARDYGGLFDDDQFANAVEDARQFLGGVAYEPFAGRRSQQASLRRATSDGIQQLIGAVVLDPAPATDAAPYARLDPPTWHLVQVLKRLTRSLVIDRPDIAVLQAGQKRVLRDLGSALFQWVRDDAARLPTAVREGIAGYPGFPPEQSERAVIDYLAGLTDEQAYALHRALHGHELPPLTSGFVM